MAEVEVIKAVDGPILRKRDYEGNPLIITRQRVMRDFCQGKYRQLPIHWKWENIMSIRQCLILYVQGKM